MDEAEAQRQQELINRYNALVREQNYEADRFNRLQYEVASCQQDIGESIAIISDLKRAVMPHLESTADETDKEEVIASNVSMTIDDLVEKYKLLKNGSTASKNLTGDYDTYYTKYGLYSDLRRVSLGYVVGLDANIWNSDAPRKTVEKMYLANTDYWLAYATMAVMLWASDEKEACERAVSKSMQIDERRSALYFLLASLRFNRTEAAKQWYRVYFDLVDSGGVGEEIIYILQVLLCGALGPDAEFADMVKTRMTELLAESKSDAMRRKELQDSVDGYFSSYISVTRKEYLDLKHICGDYPQMLGLLSLAEKNELLRDYFKSVLTASSPLSDRLSERIEDALYALISSYDVAEEELLDKIKYEEFVVKANGDLDAAQASFGQYMKEKEKSHNLALIMAHTALGRASKADVRVKQYALEYIGPEALAGAEKFAGYRSREKKEYDFEVDGCKLHGDENSFEANKPKLLEYYDGIVKNSIKTDKSVKSVKKVLGGGAALFVLFAVLSAVSFIVGWGTGANVTLIIIAVLGVGMIALSAVGLHSQNVRIRKSYEFRINNGIKMLDDGLKDLAAWRNDYRTADAVHAELINVLKEVMNNG